LIALGYRENEQFVIGTRFTQGNPAGLPAAVRDLLKAGSDILFTCGTNPTKAAQAATTSVPIVFAEAVADPVGLGLVKSMARPGGNLTGVTDLLDELIPKRIEVFKEMLPGLKRVILIHDPSAPGAAAAMRRNREAARKVGVTLVERPVRSEAEARAALADTRRGEDGLIAGGATTFNITGVALDAASQHRLPAIFNASFFPEQGALASYGPDIYESGRQAARLVDKIIKGEKPATIPVEENSRIELVINLKAAKALGVTLSPAAVQRATRIIE
jgi:putative ABC transport system substrate-binding protein